MVEDALVAVARGEDSIHPIRTREMQKLGGNGLAGVLEEVFGPIAEQRDDVVDHGRLRCSFPLGKRGMIVESANTSKETGRRPNRNVLVLDAAFEN